MAAGGFPGGSRGPCHSSHAELENLRARLAQDLEKVPGDQAMEGQGISKPSKPILSAERIGTPHFESFWLLRTDLSSAFLWPFVCHEQFDHVWCSLGVEEEHAIAHYKQHSGPVELWCFSPADGNHLNLRAAPHLDASGSGHALVPWHDTGKSLVARKILKAPKNYVDPTWVANPQN